MVINVMDLVQLKAYARQYGVALAMVWAASFLSIVFAPASVLGSLLALSTPIVVGWFLVRFRNGALDGHISFRRGYAFSCYTFFYASLLFAAVQFVYLRFFDHGAFMAMLGESFKTMEDVYRHEGAAAMQAVGQMKQTISMVGQLSPLQLTFVVMMDNLFIGALLSLPIALACRRKAFIPTDRQQEQPEQHEHAE